MNELDKFMSDIDSKKKEIARAISLAWSSGNKSQALKEYPYIYDIIKNCKHYIFKTNSLNNSYVKSIDCLLDEIDKKIEKFSVKNNFYKKEQIRFSGNPFEGDTFEMNKNIVNKLQRKYLASRNMFLRLGISFQTFIDIVGIKGEQEALELVKLVKLLDRKNKFYDLKSYLFSQKDKVFFKINMKNAINIIDEYKIKSIDDLFELHTLISSFFVEVRLLNDEEKDIIEENKQKLKDLISDEKLWKSKMRLLSLKAKVEKIFNDEMLNNVINNSNCKDFFDRYDISFSSENLLILLKDYHYVYQVDGFKAVREYDKKDNDMIYLNNRILGAESKYVNEVILHEYIHCLEDKVKDKTVKPFCIKCKYVNEALTEFLSLEAVKYLNCNIIEKEDSKISNGKYKSVYACLLPMVRVLKNSSLWNDFLYCKKANDYSLLEERIGSYAMEISRLFDTCYFKNNIVFFYYNLPEENELEQLVNIVNIIENKYPRYNKKTTI